jgi:hypothetical protein
VAVEEVFEDTVDEVKSHPWLFIGGFAVLVVIILWMKRGSSSAGQNFTFSYGPSDAQVAAGTQLAIAQQADQTSLAQSTLAASTASTVYGDYFSYLAQQGNNAVTVNQSNNNLAADNANIGYQENLYDTNASYLSHLNDNVTSLAGQNIGYQENLYDTNAAYLTTMTRGANG